ncbi:MAG: diphthine--ammonia ligase [Candidatus Hydrothermarchaeales archaeon]
MKLGALISGGKDSLFAMYLMHIKGHEIKYLITMLPKRTNSYMFHHPNAHLTKLQAEAMGLPIISRETEGKKEEELEDLLEAIISIRDDIDGIVTGALASTYQKTRIDSICKEVGLRSLAPLWGKDGEELWEDLLKEGFEVIVTSVAAEGLDKAWLGKKVDSAAFKSLKELSKKYRFHLGFEGGEAETLVLDMPLFKRKIKIIKARKEWDGVRGVYIVEEARHENKNDA